MGGISEREMLVVRSSALRSQTHTAASADAALDRVRLPWESQQGQGLGSAPSVSGPGASSALPALIQTLTEAFCWLMEGQSEEGDLVKQERRREESTDCHGSHSGVGLKGRAFDSR